MQKKRHNYRISNLIQIMRISFMLWCLLFTTCIVFASNKSFGQKELDKIIHVDFKNISLKDALEQLQTKYLIPLAYSNEDNSLTSKINYSAHKQAKYVLKDILQTQNMTYEVRHDFVRLVRRTSTITTRKNQENIVTGIVTNTEKQPLQGVTVTIKGKSYLKTSTDFNGRFVLNAPKGSTLVISLVGHVTQEIAIGNQQEVAITLEEDLTGIEEVVVVGYGTQKTESNVGSQSTIKRQELKVPVANLSTAIAGRLAGVVATQRGGGPGSGGADLFVRGVATFSSSPQKPLLV